MLFWYVRTNLFRMMGSSAKLVITFGEERMYTWTVNSRQQQNHAHSHCMSFYTKWLWQQVLCWYVRAYLFLHNGLHVTGPIIGFVPFSIRLHQAFRSFILVLERCHSCLERFRVRWNWTCDSASRQPVDTINHARQYVMYHNKNKHVLNIFNNKYFALWILPG